MLFAKRKKAVISLAAAAVMTLGGVTAFASAPELTLTPAGNVDVSKIVCQKGEVEIVKEIDSEVLSGFTGTTAPGSASQLTLIPVYDVDVSKIDYEMGDPSQLEVVKEIDPKTVGGTGKTEPGPAKDSR